MSLFHYTSITAFENIVKSNFFRFSQLENANDKRERYAFFNDDLFSKCYYICTTRNFDNAALWYHYANRHNGVCIELELPKDKFSFSDIEYDGKYADLNKRLSSMKDAQNFLSHKTKCWRYEEETRCFFIGQPDFEDDFAGIKNFLPLIKSIIIGNAFEYHLLSNETIQFLNKLKNDKNLYSISWYQGAGTKLIFQSPKLQQKK